MECIQHGGRAAIGVCTLCGAAVCRECSAGGATPIRCNNCRESGPRDSRSVTARQGRNHAIAQSSVMCSNCGTYYDERRTIMIGDNDSMCERCFAEVNDKILTQIWAERRSVGCPVLLLVPIWAVLLIYMRMSGTSEALRYGGTFMLFFILWVLGLLLDKWLSEKYGLLTGFGRFKQAFRAIDRNVLDYLERVDKVMRQYVIGWEKRDADSPYLTMIRNNSRDGRGQPHQEVPLRQPGTGSESRTMTIDSEVKRKLDQRLASGEISVQEYHALIRTLVGAGGDHEN